MSYWNATLNWPCDTQEVLIGDYDPCGIFQVDYLNYVRLLRIDPHPQLISSSLLPRGTTYQPSREKLKEENALAHEIAQLSKVGGASAGLGKKDVKKEHPKKKLTKKKSDTQKPSSPDQGTRSVSNDSSSGKKHSKDKLTQRSSLQKQTDIYIRNYILDDANARACSLALSHSSHITALHLWKVQASASAFALLIHAALSNPVVEMLALDSISFDLLSGVNPKHSYPSIDLSKHILFGPLSTVSPDHILNQPSTPTTPSSISMKKKSDTILSLKPPHYSLKHLSLRGNGYGHNELPIIAQLLLQNTTLLSLNLWGNRLNGPNLALLADALTKNTTLLDLSLGNNKIHDIHALPIIMALGLYEISPDVLSQRKKSLLDLEKNLLELEKRKPKKKTPITPSTPSTSEIREGGMSVPQTQTTKKKLSLIDQITEQIAQLQPVIALSPKSWLVHGNRTLISFDLSSNLITDQCLPQLKQIVQYNETLQYFFFDRNNVSDEIIDLVQQQTLPSEIVDNTIPAECDGCED